MPQSFANDNSWRDDLWLLTKAELEVVPPGTVLTSIMGEEKIVGQARLSNDTRFGYLAYGLYSTQFKH